MGLLIARVPSRPLTGTTARAVRSLQDGPDGRKGSTLPPTPTLLPTPPLAGWDMGELTPASLPTANDTGASSEQVLAVICRHDLPSDIRGLEARPHIGQQHGETSDIITSRRGNSLTMRSISDYRSDGHLSACISRYPAVVIEAENMPRSEQTFFRTVVEWPFFPVTQGCHT